MSIVECVGPDRAAGTGRPRAWGQALRLIGPGLVVMLADTDAGSIITAAQSGARWGYRLLPLEILLIPVLYLVMELTMRLGTTTGKGHAQAIRDRFGPRWAVVSVATLLISATGALITEFAGIAAAGSFVGLGRFETVPAAALFLIVVVVSGGYRRVELIALALGSFELAFVLAAVMAHPRAGALTGALWAHQPLGHRDYLTLVAANLGAVVMPWMIFYQQGAVVDKGLGPQQIRIARVDTALGAVLSQTIMIAVLIVCAGALFTQGGASLSSVSGISAALTPFLGASASHVTLGVGLTGASLVAAIVVSLAASWAVAEAAGARRSLNDAPRSAPLFYGIYAMCVAVGAATVLAVHSVVGVAIVAEVVNALLLPVVLGFLVALAWATLPRPHRLRRHERFVLPALAASVTAIGFAWTVLVAM